VGVAGTCWFAVANFVSTNLIQLEEHTIFTLVWMAPGDGNDLFSITADT
jgi:hypothetical protein